MVRSYRDSDRTEIERILADLGWDERFTLGQLRTIERLGEVPTGAVYVEAVPGSLQGFVSVELHEWNGLAQIQGLAVPSANRRRGVATALLAAAEGFARDSDARGIYVDTPVNNDGARGFYESCGYRVDYVMSRYYGDDLDGVTYVRFF